MSQSVDEDFSWKCKERGQMCNDDVKCGNGLREAEIVLVFS